MNEIKELGQALKENNRSYRKGICRRHCCLATLANARKIDLQKATLNKFPSRAQKVKSLHATVYFD
jgi:hypothetical protein